MEKGRSGNTTKKGKRICYEVSNGGLNGNMIKKAMRFTMKVVTVIGLKWEYDEKDNEIYYENSNGY